ncbi:MAG TPA: copper chaperone PCu(A)C [Sphingobium sp.]|uniref:copper chaperone PCu(A)C n=1 Tax=Sphingobium sp. TaxID=1912891 RepID=UPI002ED0FED7
MRSLLTTLLPAIGLIALTGCEKAPLYVDKATIRLSPNPETPSAGYFTVHGGSDPVTLRDVTSEAAIRVEMHDSVMKNGMMSMQRLDSVDIPAKSVVKFEPGGRHLMIWKVNPGIAATGKVTLTFIFSNGDRILVDAAVQKTGEAAPKDNGMGNMGNMTH